MQLVPPPSSELGNETTMKSSLCDHVQLPFSCHIRTVHDSSDAALCNEATSLMSQLPKELVSFQFSTEMLINLVFKLTFLV